MPPTGAQGIKQQVIIKTYLKAILDQDRSQLKRLVGIGKSSVDICLSGGGGPRKGLMTTLCGMGSHDPMGSAGGPQLQTLGTQKVRLSFRYTKTNTLNLAQQLHGSRCNFFISRITCWYLVIYFPSMCLAWQLLVQVELVVLLVKEKRMPKDRLAAEPVL